MGAPVGNQNAVKAKRFQQALDRALAKKSKADGIEALDRIAETLVNAAIAGPNYEKGDPWPGAIMHLADRIDGKTRQQIEAVDDEGRPLAIGLVAYTAAVNNPAPIQPAPVSTPGSSSD